MQRVASLSYQNFRGLGDWDILQLAWESSAAIVLQSGSNKSSVGEIWCRSVWTCGVALAEAISRQRRYDRVVPGVGRAEQLLVFCPTYPHRMAARTNCSLFEWDAQLEEIID